MNQEGEEVAANAADNELDPLSGVRSKDKCSNNKGSQLSTCQGRLGQRLASCKLHAPGKLGESTTSCQDCGGDGDEDKSQKISASYCMDLNLETPFECQLGRLGVVNSEEEKRN